MLVWTTDDLCSLNEPSQPEGREPTKKERNGGIIKFEHMADPYIVTCIPILCEGQGMTLDLMYVFISLSKV